MKQKINIDDGSLNLNEKFDNIDNIRRIYESTLHFFITYDVYGEYSDEIYINHFVIGKYEMTEKEIQDFRYWCAGKFDIKIKKESLK